MTTTPLALIAILVTACATRNTPAPAPPTVPAGWRLLAGPHATLGSACDGCQLSAVTPLASSSGFVGVALGTRGLESVLALQTSRGWYIEQREPMQPMSSHHEPRSISYELARTRIGGDGVIVRMIDSHQVFYPGQGNAGTSSTSWFDRTCRVVGERVACGAPLAVGTQHCSREMQGDGNTKETCR